VSLPRRFHARFRARFRAAFDAAVAVQSRFSAIRGGNLAAAISMRAFLALFPIAILAIGVIGLVGGDPSTTGADLAKALGLGSEFSDTLSTSIQAAEDSQVASGIIGIVGLIWTGTGLASAFAAAWDAAWEEPGGSLRGRGFGVLWLIGGLAFLAATVATSVLFHRFEVLLEFGVIGGIIANTGFLLWTAFLLPTRSIPWRAMLVPALAGGIALEVLRAVGATVVPALVRRSSTVYGAIGATFALLVWLLVMGEVIVAVAVFERYRWGRRPVTD
jgi:membrane protein